MIDGKKTNICTKERWLRKVGREDSLEILLEVTDEQRKSPTTNIVLSQEILNTGDFSLLIYESAKLTD